jgi:putative ATP-dependent endonuclease of OLD family
LIYLPAYRNPIDELARREAEIVVELLRAEQERRSNHRNLASIRALAGVLLDSLVAHDLIRSIEARVSDYLASLTGGVSRHHAFAGRQEVDDAFLARVLEFLLSSVDQRTRACADARQRSDHRRGAGFGGASCACTSGSGVD